jgi:hypothetical protein
LPWAFQGGAEKLHTVGEIRTFSEAAAATLIKQIHARLLYEQENALIFYPSPCNLHAGWHEFLEFSRGFNYLPSDVLNSLGPFFLIMQTPS